METRAEIVNEVIKLLQKKKYRYEIKQYFEEWGIGLDDFDSICDEAQEIYDHQKGKTRREKLLWFSLSAIALISFLFLIPNSIYNKSPFIVSITCAVIVTCLWARGVNDMEGWRKSDKRLLLIPIILTSLIFLTRFSDNEAKELKQYGKIVKGTIMDGSSSNVYLGKNKGKLNYVTVNFATLDGKEITVEEKVNSAEYATLHSNQIVDIIYSERDPNIIDLLINSADIEKYTGFKERKISITDLITLTGVDSTAVENVLRNICYGWERVNEHSWGNARFETAVRISDHKVRCVTMEVPLSEFEKQLQRASFKYVESSGAMKEYESPQYFVTLQNEETEKGEVCIIEIISKQATSD